MYDRSAAVVLLSVQDFVGEDHLARSHFGARARAFSTLVDRSRERELAWQPLFDLATTTACRCTAIAGVDLSRRTAKAARDGSTS